MNACEYFIEACESHGAPYMSLAINENDVSFDKKATLKLLANQVNEHPDKGIFTIHYNGAGVKLDEQSLKKGAWMCPNGDKIFIDDILQTCNDARTCKNKLWIRIIADCSGARYMYDRMRTNNSEFPTIAQVIFYFPSATA